MKYEGKIRTNILDWVSLLLVIIGALVWGLVGLGIVMEANWNVIDLVLGPFPMVEATVYMIVGLAGLYEFYFAYQLYRARTAKRMTRA